MNNENIVIEAKTLSSNQFLAFFQKIFRWWLGVWYGFQDKHPVASKWIYKLFFFIVFSEGVTILQFIVMTFLPYAFTSVFPDKAVGWPNIALPFASENNAVFTIFGDNHGWGYFLSFEIAVFLAQCINFPLQRNITYKSKGNPVFQAVWYFIGWVLISIVTNAVWGFCNAILTSWGWYLPGKEGLATIAGLLKTVLTGGVSMAIFFFIFIIIFPDLNKAAKLARKKATANPTEENNRKADEAEKKATYDNARRDVITYDSLASAKAVSYNSSIARLEKIKKLEKTTPEDIKKQEEAIEKRHNEAIDAAKKKIKAHEVFEALNESK